VSRPIDPDPIRRPAPSVYAPPVWPVRRRLKFGEIAVPHPSDFASIMAARRSVRRMKAAPTREILNLVAWATRPEREWSTGGIRRSLRMTPSAGALHAVVPLIIPPKGQRILRIDGSCREVDVIEPLHVEALSRFRQKISEFAPHAASCHALALVAERTRVEACYENVSTLMLRDAGALLQTLLLAACAFRLSGLPLAMIGGEIVSAIFGDGGAVEAVGALLVGRQE
jgi:hypothetical protein